MQPKIICEYRDCAFFSCELQNYEQAIRKKNRQKVMNGDVIAIEKNHTWKLIYLSKDKDFIGMKWIYKTKFLVDGTVKKQVCLGA